MEEKKRFQGKKLNKKENDSIKKVAKGVKDGVGLLMISAIVATGIKNTEKMFLRLGRILFLRLSLVKG